MCRTALVHVMGIPRPARHERRRVWPASPSHVKRRKCPNCRGVVGDEVAVASGSSMRPRIPKNAPGTPGHGAAFLKSAHGTRRFDPLLLEMGLCQANDDGAC